jgi:hypothetical protein
VLRFPAGWLIQPHQAPKDKVAPGHPRNTGRALCNYEHHLSVSLEYTGDTEVDQTAAQHLRAFLVWLCTDYTPYSHPPRKISNLYSGQVPP